MFIFFFVLFIFDFYLLLLIIIDDFQCLLSHFSFYNKNLTSLSLSIIGLTAAESVLREFLHRKALDIPCPSRLWFLWSCTNVDDLFWCWDQLLGLVSAAVQAGVIVPLRKQRGALIDWLGVTIYLTRGSKAFDDFVQIQRAKFTADNRDVGEWLLQRIYRSSMDSKHTHIESLLRGAHRVLRQTPTKTSRDLALGFCGPPALAHVIERAAHRSLPDDAGNITFNFSMDHQ